MDASGYMNALREAGAVPFMPALTTDRQEIGQIFGMCDGLVMTGGHDVNPACYGESDQIRQSALLRCAG